MNWEGVGQAQLHKDHSGRVLPPWSSELSAVKEADSLMSNFLGGGGGWFSV